MATVSKSKRRNAPGKTKNGKVKLSSLSLLALEEMLPKARPRDQHKIRHFINNIVKKTKSKVW